MSDNENSYRIADAVAGGFLGAVIVGVLLLGIGRHDPISDVLFWFLIVLGAAIGAFGAVIGGESFWDWVTRQIIRK